ncbi:MAG: hypothetical protein ACM3MI_10805 [Clostridiales bacterium]
MLKRKFHPAFNAFIILLFSITLFNCASTNKEKMEKDFQQFVKDYETKVIPLSNDANLAYFNATISGKKEDYDKSAELEIKRSMVYTSKEDFEKLKKFKESGAITDPTLKRELETLYNAYLENQVDTKKLEEIIKLRTDVENKFSTFRAVLNGKKMTDNEIE